MELKQIEQLADIINNKKLSEITIEENGTKITVKQHISNVIGSQEFNMANNFSKGSCDSVNSNSVDISIKNDDYKIVKSPMVGIFYSANSPESAPFVTVGQQIKKGDVVCIIEAMKLMNEIVSDIEGEVVEVCVKNGDAVSYAQTIIKVK